MTDQIIVDHETSTENLMLALRTVLGELEGRIGTARVIATLFGTATLMVQDSAEEWDGR